MQAQFSSFSGCKTSCLYCNFLNIAFLLLDWSDSIHRLAYHGKVTANQKNHRRWRLCSHWTSQTIEARGLSVVAFRDAGTAVGPGSVKELRAMETCKKQ